MPTFVAVFFSCSSPRACRPWDRGAFQEIVVRNGWFNIDVGRLLANNYFPSHVIWSPNRHFGQNCIGILHSTKWFHCNRWVSSLIGVILQRCTVKTNIVDKKLLIHFYFVLYSVELFTRNAGRRHTQLNVSAFYCFCRRLWGHTEDIVVIHIRIKLIIRTHFQLVIYVEL